MGWITGVSSRYQPVGKSGEPVGDQRLGVTPVILGKGIGEHLGLHFRWDGRTTLRFSKHYVEY
jgi:hypothetical protein